VLWLLTSCPLHSPPPTGSPGATATDTGPPQGSPGCQEEAARDLLHLHHTLQIFGGAGYNRDYPVEKLMRDAKIFQVGEDGARRLVIGYLC